MCGTPEFLKPSKGSDGYDLFHCEYLVYRPLVRHPFTTVSAADDDGTNDGDLSFRAEITAHDYTPAESSRQNNHATTELADDGGIQNSQQPTYTYTQLIHQWCNTEQSTANLYTIETPVVEYRTDNRQLIHNRYISGGIQNR